MLLLLAHAHARAITPEWRPGAKGQGAGQVTAAYALRQTLRTRGRGVGGRGVLPGVTLVQPRCKARQDASSHLLLASPQQAQQHTWVALREWPAPLQH